MTGQLYQVSYLGSTYYAVPVYYPGSAIFQAWYLIAYIGGQLYPYTIVPANAVTILYNPYLGTGGGTGGSTGGGTGGGTGSTGVTVSDTAPTSPTNGQLWYNSSGSTVSGVPSGNYARWNSTTNQWEVLGTGTPAGVTGVVALNGGTGVLTLAGTSGVTVSRSGQTITITGSGSGGSSSGADEQSVLVSDTAPTSPVNGQVWYNSSNGTVSGVPSKNFARWNASTNSWTVLGTSPPAGVSGVVALNDLAGAVNLVAGSNVTITKSGQNITINSSGSGSGGSFVPTPGSVDETALAPGANNTWLHTTSGGVVQWDPLTIPNTDRNPGFVARLGGLTAIAAAVAQVIAPVEVVDPLSGYNPSTGQFVVPAGYGGVWMIGLTLLLSAAGTPGLNVSGGATKNSTVFVPNDLLASDAYIVSGFRPYILVPGDIVRWYSLASAPTTVEADSILYGFLLFPLP